MKNERVRIFIDRYRSILIAFLVMIIVLALFASKQADFFTKYGPQSIFNQIITLCIASLGQTVIIITSGVDLSIGSSIILCNCITATIMQPMIDVTGSNIAGCLFTIAIVLFAGAACGLFNGVLVVFGRLQPIVVTLATSSIFNGLARRVRPTPGGEVWTDFARLMTGRVFDYIPMAAIVLLLVIFLIWRPYRKSRYGQAIYAIGGNENAAYLSGINIKKAKLSAYMVAGIAYAICGIMLTAQTRAGDPTAENNYGNNTIAAVVLGGASLSGGKGSYYGSVAGAVILSLIIGLLIFWKISSYYQNLIQGLILIVALSTEFIADLIQQRRKRARTRELAGSVEE